MNYQAGDISRIPVLYDRDKNNQIELISKENIFEAKLDWDAFETSWDFQRHPLLRKVPTISEAFDQWQTECIDRFNQLI